MHGTRHNEIGLRIIWKHLHIQYWYHTYWIGLKCKIQMEYQILGQIYRHIIGRQPWLHSTTTCILMWPIRFDHQYGELFLFFCDGFCGHFLFFCYNGVHGSEDLDPAAVTLSVHRSGICAVRPYLLTRYRIVGHGFVIGIRRRLRKGMSCTVVKGQTTIGLARSDLKGLHIQWGSWGWTAQNWVQRGLKQRPHMHITKGLLQAATSYGCKSKTTQKTKMQT